MFRSINAGNVYTGALSAAAAVSIVHYFTTFAKVRGDVPIHFNIYGQPDNFVGRRYYFLYPILTAATCALGYALHDRAALNVREKDRPALHGVMLSSLYLLLSGQVFAFRIANGTSSKVPSTVMALGIFAIASCTLYSVVNGVVNT